jgi:hypothetical protein
MIYPIKLYPGDYENLMSMYNKNYIYSYSYVFNKLVQYLVGKTNIYDAYVFENEPLEKANNRIELYINKLMRKFRNQEKKQRDREQVYSFALSTHNCGAKLLSIQDVWKLCQTI